MISASTTKVKGFFMPDDDFNKRCLRFRHEIKTQKDAENFVTMIDEDCRFGSRCDDATCYFQVCSKCHHLICTMIQHFYCSKDSVTISFACLCDSPFTSMSEVYSPITEMYGRNGTITEFTDLTYILKFTTSRNEKWVLIPFKQT